MTLYPRRLDQNRLHKPFHADYSSQSDCAVKSTNLVQTQKVHDFFVYGDLPDLYIRMSNKTNIKSLNILNFDF